MTKINVPFAPAFVFNYNRWRDNQTNNPAEVFDYREAFTLNQTDRDTIAKQDIYQRDKPRTAFVIKSTRHLINTLSEAEKAAYKLSDDDIKLLITVSVYTGHPNLQATQGGIFQADLVAHSRWLGSINPNIPFMQGNKFLTNNTDAFTITTGGRLTKQHAEELDISVSNDEDAITAEYHYKITRPGSTHKITVDPDHYNFKIDAHIWNNLLVPEAWQCLNHTPLCEEDLFKLTPFLINTAIRKHFIKKISLESKELQAFAKKLIICCFHAREEEQKSLLQELNSAISHITTTLSSLKTICKEYHAQLKQQHPLHTALSQLLRDLNASKPDGEKINDFIQTYQRFNLTTSKDPDTKAFTIKILKIIATLLIAIPTLGLAPAGLALYGKFKYNDWMGFWKTNNERFLQTAQKACAGQQKYTFEPLSPSASLAQH